MRHQQQVWENEHSSQAMLPALANSEPSSGVEQFIAYLNQSQIPIVGTVIDIGCGRGRNSAYLAEQGLEVFAVDYIDKALKAARQLAKRRRQLEGVHFLKSEIDQPWSFPDDFFDFAVDCFSSIDVETKPGRETCRNEMFRTLKAGGYALVTVVSADDAWETDPMITKPADEPNSVIWLANEKFQKNYDENELREFYKDFTVVELKKIQKPATKLGKDGIATNYWLVLQKPAQDMR